MSSHVPRDAFQNRLQRLLEAHRTVAQDLALPAMLGRIVRAACAMVGASGGAMSVLGSDGRIERVVHHGLDDVVLDRIAAAMDDQQLRWALASTVDGVDGRHLDEAICVRGVRFGRLYLLPPHGARFDRNDAELLVALTSYAGSAIDNARLYEDAQRSKDWLHASGEIARALLGDADADALMEVVSRALHVAEADYAALILPTVDGMLKVAVTVGLGAEEFRGMVFEPKHSEIGRAILAGRSLLSIEMSELADVDYVNDLGYGPAMVAPLVDAQGVRGSVLLIRTGDRVPFGTRDLDLATTFADQVTLALQLNDARVDAQSLHVLEDRHEVSRALHDSVMQRLFATGMGLQGIADRDLPVELAERLRQHVGDLDDTIEQIRARMFKTRPDRDARDQTGNRFARVPHDARMAQA